MKYFLFLIIITLTIGCDHNNNGLEVDSPEAISRLRADLKLKDQDVAKTIHYWSDIDSSTVAFFETDSSTIANVIRRLQMKPDTIGKDYWIPDNSPVWFAPSLSTGKNRIKTWVKVTDGRRLFLQLHQEKNVCYFANLKWESK